jgi:uncharacterized membrane protein
MERHVKWILLVSLLINAVLVGYIAGQMGRGGPMAVFSRRVMPPERRADETTRVALKETFEAERPALEKAMKDSIDARRESVEILRTEPLDAARLDASLAKLRAGNSATQESFHRALAAAAGKLNARQRVSLGRMLDRASSGRSRRAGPISGAFVDIVNGQSSDGPRGPISGAVVDIINGPQPRSPESRPLPDGMGLGAPVPPPAE